MLSLTHKVSLSGVPPLVTIAQSSDIRNTSIWPLTSAPSIRNSKVEIRNFKPKLRVRRRSRRRFCSSADRNNADSNSNRATAA